MDKHLSMLVLALATTFTSVRAQWTFKEAIPNNPFAQPTQAPVSTVLEKVKSLPLPPWKGELVKGDPLSEYTSECQALEISPNGAFLAVAGDEPFIQIYNTGTAQGTVQWSLFTQLKPNTVSNTGKVFDNVFWSADGSSLVASTYSGAVHVWSTLTWKLVRSAVIVTDQKDAKGKKKVGPHSMIIALSPDSKTLAVASRHFASEQDKTEGKPDFAQSSLNLLDFKSFEHKQEVKETVKSFAWAPDGKKVVFALWNTGSDALSNRFQVFVPKTKKVKGVDKTTWLLYKNIPYYGSMAYRLNFNSDSSLLAAGLQLYSKVPPTPYVLLFKTSSWEKVQLKGAGPTDSSINAPALGDSNWIMAIKFSPNGRALAIMDTWHLVVAEIDGDLATLHQHVRRLKAPISPDPIFVQTQVDDFSASLQRAAAVAWTNDGKNVLAGVNSFVNVFTVPTKTTATQAAVPLTPAPCDTFACQIAKSRLFANEDARSKPAAALASSLSGGWLAAIAAFAFLGFFITRVVVARRCSRTSRSMYYAMEPGQHAAPEFRQSLASFIADAKEDASPKLPDDFELSALGDEEDVDDVRIQHLPKQSTTKYHRFITNDALTDDDETSR